MRALLLFVAVLFLAATQATAQAPQSAVGRQFVPPARGSLVVLLPPQTEVDEFKAGVPLLVDSLHRSLEGLGYRVALLDEANFKTVWNQEALAAGGLFDPVSGAPRPEARALALSTSAVRITGETEARLVLMPRLVLRPAALAGSKADWDGQLRRVPARGVAGGTLSFRGMTTGMSVELFAFMGNGALAFRTFGGASLPFVVNFNAERQEIRKDLFDSSEELSEAVLIALKPLVPSGAR